MIRSARQTAIRALPQRIFRGMKFYLLVGHVVGRLNSCRAGVVIVELPRGECAVILRTALDLNDSSRTKISPGKFLFACPDQFHRPSGGLSQPGCFYRSIPGVLASVSRAGIRNDHAHVIQAQVKGAGQLFTHCEWALRPCPDRQPVFGPLGDRGAWLQRRVSNVGHGVGP